MAASDAQSPYLVLARKYRPRDFSALIGQEAMVKTFANAFKAGRVHHAFILTGVRGVGKTTTARILARAFNYVGPDGPRMSLDLGVEGEHCRAIIEGRHVDVIEMDAASNTGIDNIREIIDSVKYGPVSAPYKVYIIDEVHMLSTQAFNGLLKTLEEPPPYVKFIFATTEIRKVPVTILSRCQRFDLRRVPPEAMSAHFSAILDKEGIGIEPEALAMIVRAGEGSVRDGLSLLDQAIAFADGQIRAETVSAMLGLADKSRILDLFEALMGGRTAEALELFLGLYAAGAEPQTILSDLAELTHLITRIKIVPQAAGDGALTPDERKRGPELATALGMRDLTRAWQILTQGLTELGTARDARQAGEMVLIRLAYAADLPTPDDLIARLETNPPAPDDRPTPPSGGGGNGASTSRAQLVAPRLNTGRLDPTPVAAPRAAAPTERPQPRNYQELVALATAERDLQVKHALEAQLRPVSFAPGRMEVALTDSVDPSVLPRIAQRLKDWTGRNWLITLSTAEAAPPTLKEERLQTAHDDPLVRAVIETFPGARLVNVTVREGLGMGDDAPPPHEDYPDHPDDSFDREE